MELIVYHTDRKNRMQKLRRTLCSMRHRRTSVFFQVGI